MYHQYILFLKLLILSANYESLSNTFQTNLKLTLKPNVWKRRIN
jgi:hypothetical protein